MLNVKKKYIQNILLLVFIFLINLSVIAQQGYRIKLTIENLPNTSVILAHYFSDKMYPDDTITLNSKGEGVFAGDEKLPQGLYVVFLSPERYFDILLPDDQHFTIENDTANFIENITCKGSEENELFYEFNRFSTDKYQQVKELQNQRRQAIGNTKKIQEIDTELKKLFDERKERINEIINEHPDMLLSAFLKATQEIEVPEAPKDENGIPVDPRFRYKYYKHHYFDNFDVSDERLLRTPIYENKINRYLALIPPVIDSITTEVDSLIEQTRHDEDLFRFMLAHLFNHYSESKIMLMEEIFVHIAEKYYLSDPMVDWYSDEAREKLRDKVQRTKPNIIGKQSPELKMKSLPHSKEMLADLKAEWQHVREQGLVFSHDTALTSEEKDNHYINIFNEFQQYLSNPVQLREIDAKYTIIWFWEPACSHCKVATPKLGKLYQKFKNRGLEVYAVFLQMFVRDWDEFTRHTNDWFDFIIKHDLSEWYNVWDPKHHTLFRNKYDIYSSPVSYLLDENKKIVVKRVGIEQLQQVLTDMVVDDLQKKHSGEILVKEIKAFIDSMPDKSDLKYFDESIRFLDNETKREIQQYLEKREKQADK